MSTRAPFDHPASRPVPWVSSVLYVAVLGAGLYYELRGLGDAGGPPERVAGFVALLIALLALEVLERSRYPARTPSGPALALLCTRVCLFVGVAALDASELSRVLFVLVPFTAYFAFGRAVSIALAAGCFAALLIGFSLSAPGWHTDEAHLSDALMFAVGLVMATSMAAVAVGEQSGRARLQQALGAVEESHAQLTVYAAQVAELSAVAERHRLARDMHDSLGHHLTAVAVQLEKAEVFGEREPLTAQRAVRDARRSARLALDDVRRSVRAFRSPQPPFNLCAALGDLARRVDDKDVEVSLTIAGEADGFDPQILTGIYRVAQEALTNARRHARAGHAWVSLSLDGDGARLVVRDDGCGFTPAPPEAGSDKFGLVGIRERVQLLGGRVDVESSVAAGTCVSVALPRHAEPAQPAYLGVP